MIRRSSRPVGVTILAVLEVLIGIVGLLASLAIIGLSGMLSTLPRVGLLLGSFGPIIGGLVLFFSLIWLATGVGFLHGRGWSWTLGMIFSIVSLFGAIGALTIGLITGGVGGLIFWGLMMYYLTRTHVKAFFGKGGLPLSPSYGLPYSLGPQANQPPIAITNNAGYGRPASAGPPAAFPPVARGASTSVPASNNVPATASSGSSGKAPVCPYCHNTLPMGTKKCLTCGAAL